MENKQRILINEEDQTLEGGHAKYLVLDLSVGQDIEFHFRASNTVNLYIFTSEQYSPRVKGGYLIVAPNEKELLEVSQGTLGYRVSATDTYYFVIYNIHSGLSLGEESVGLYSIKVTAYVQEEVTKQRTETRYRTVSTIRTETHTREVTVRATLIGLLSGSYKTR